MRSTVCLCIVLRCLGAVFEFGVFRILPGGTATLTDGPIAWERTEFEVFAAGLGLRLQMARPPVRSDRTAVLLTILGGPLAGTLTL